MINHKLLYLLTLKYLIIRLINNFSKLPAEFHPAGKKDHNPSVYGELEVPFPPVICTEDIRYRTGRTA